MGCQDDTQKGEFRFLQKKKSNSSHGSDKFLGAGKTLWSKGALQGKK